MIDRLNELFDGHRGAIAVIGTNGSGKSCLAETLHAESRVPSELVTLELQYAVMEEERYNDDSEYLEGADPGRSALEYISEAGPVTPEVAELFDHLRMQPILPRGLKFLSTGEFRKVLICRALLTQPQRLILDEPFDGLDLDSQIELKQLLNRLVSQLQLILFVNRLDEIVASVEQIVVLDEAGIVLSGPAEDVMNSECLTRFFKLHELPETLPQLAGTEPDAWPADQQLIEMKKVRVAYNDAVIFDGLDWSVAPKEHYQISGPNGCGKSTLLELVSGDHSQVYCNDVTVFGIRRGSGESVWDIKKHIGHISSSVQGSYRVSATVLQTVVSGFHDSIGLYCKPSLDEQQVAREWLKILHLAHKANQSLRSLSYGEQRLVLIARAMIKQPRLLILDEPCLGLDEINRRTILKLIEYIGTQTNTTLLYVSHHADDAVPCIQKKLTFNAPTA
jgi:molybdate transport system ATP-binding protein